METAANTASLASARSNHNTYNKFDISIGREKYRMNQIRVTTNLTSTGAERYGYNHRNNASTARTGFGGKNRWVGMGYVYPISSGKNDRVFLGERTIVRKKLFGIYE